MGDVKVFYPEFVPNQILTNTQLNQLREHLEGQELSTRLRLTGTGIVCGFTWALVTTPKPAIKLSSGYGLSSSGELIEQCDPALYTHRRAYVDPDKDEAGALRYLPWRDPADSAHKTQRDIIELIDDKSMAAPQPPEGAIALTAADLTGGSPLIQNRVLVLYLEHQPVDLNSCLVSSCDNKGLNINVRVRALLVKESDLAAAPDCALPPALERIPRMHTIHKPQEITDPTRLAEAFANVVTARAPVLGPKIKSLFDLHAGFLDLDGFAGADPLAGKLVGADPAQYRYDALVDFATAYNEAALAAYGLVEQCCGSDTFPRHLMLGALDGTPLFRNEFLPAAIRNVAQGELERVRALFLRLRAMINSLGFAGYPAAATIQPSHSAEYPLGRRARPYYFSSVAPDYWRTRGRCAVDPDWPWRKPPVSTGTDTDYAEASWLRIEGHVNAPHGTAATQIAQQRDAGNVQFCLLRTYFDDRAAEEAELRKKIAQGLVAPLDSLPKAKEAVAKLIVKGGGDFGPLVELAIEREKRNSGVAKASEGWQAMRRERTLYCEPAAVEADYLEARSELLCIAARLLGMLQRVRIAVEQVDAEALLGPGMDAIEDGALYALADRILGAILAAPQKWDTPDEIKSQLDWSGLPKLDELDLLRLAMDLGIEALQAQVRSLLEGTLPKSLGQFDYEVFAAQHRALARALLEFRVWLGVLGSVLTGANDGQPGKDGDAPLHPAETVLVDADLLGLARTCLPVQLATAYCTYEAMRAQDLSLYRNLAQTDGLEHLAGVGKGGTFILLCDTSASAGKVLADLSLAGCAPCCCGIDPQDICLPPLALPDVRVVTLVAGKESGYEPVQLTIFVGGNDYDLNGAGKIPPKVTIELLTDRSELGAKLKAQSAQPTVDYLLQDPVPGVVDRFRYRLRIEAEDGCSGEAIGEVAVVFAVPPRVTGRIDGIVFELEMNKPSSGAAVKLSDTAFNATTDSKGRFVFESVPVGSYTAVASKDTLRSEPASVAVQADATTSVTLLLKATAVNGLVAVKVTDAPGKPITSAAVQLRNDTGSVNPTQPTNSSGDAVFQNVPAGSYTASASASGFLSDSVGPFPLAGGQTQVQTIRLKTIQIVAPPQVIDSAIDILGIGPVEASARVRKLLTERARGYADVISAATDDPKVLGSDAYAKASTFLSEQLADPAKTDAQLASDYQDASAALVTAAKQSSGTAKAAYQEMLSAVSMAYLDRVAAANPKTLSADAAADVKGVGAALKGAGVNLTALRTQWGGDALKSGIGIDSAAAIGGMLG